MSINNHSLDVKQQSLDAHLVLNNNHSLDVKQQSLNLCSLGVKQQSLSLDVKQQSLTWC